MVGNLPISSFFYRLPDGVKVDVALEQTGQFFSDYFSGWRFFEKHENCLRHQRGEKGQRALAHNKSQ